MHVVISTAPAKSAETLAFKLVEEHVAACVNILPNVTSVYRWKGAIERAEEVLLVVKTGSESLATLMQRLAELHPYEVPEIVAFDTASVHPPYAAWVAEETDAAKSG